jgi:hypothetical protein
VKPKTIILAIACAFAVAGLFGPGSQPSSGQERRKGTEAAPGGCFICGNMPGMHTAMFEGADWFGTLSWDACPIKKYSEDNPEKLKGICQQIKTEFNFTSFKTSCPSLAPYCEPEAKGPSKEKEPPETKCDKPTPWFDSSSDCSEVQSPVIRINTGAVTVTICGYPVFRQDPGSTDPLYLEAYRDAVRDWVRSRVGNTVCCNKLREAARTGTPCYPAVDIDCDGKPNQTDVVDGAGNLPYPDINGVFTRSEGAPIDPFPAGLDPNDPNFRPESAARDSRGVGECDCKWELIKGDLKCSPDGRQQHVYTATWRCPSTKAEVFTTKYAPATAPCSAQP